MGEFLKMNTWDIYDESGNWLGTASGFTESEAVTNAKSQGMTGAAKAELYEE
jgi:hypothetical protein